MPGKVEDAAFAPYPGRPGKYLADMYALARACWRAMASRACAGGEHCTATETDWFYSYRRDGVTGRQASLIWLPDGNPISRLQGLLARTGAHFHAAGVAASIPRYRKV